MGVKYDFNPSRNLGLYMLERNENLNERRESQVNFNFNLYGRVWINLLNAKEREREKKNRGVGWSKLNMKVM